MVKIRDTLTNEELAEVRKLKTKMLDSETRKELYYYRMEIEKIFELAKDRYSTSEKHSSS